MTIQQRIPIKIYTMQNIFSIFLCFAPYFAYHNAISNTFSCNDEARFFLHMEPRIYRRLPLNRSLGKAKFKSIVSNANIDTRVDFCMVSFVSHMHSALTKAIGCVTGD